MGIMLGNMSVPQIEERLGIKLSDEDAAELNAHRQEPVNNTPLAAGCWHCFYIPFMIMTDTRATAQKIVQLFTKYEPSKFKEALQISWERDKDVETSCLQDG